MLISVVIPVYNIEKDLLKRSLGSVLVSDSADIEVVVIDDGSEESHSHEYSCLCNDDHRVRYIKKENGGPSSARNFGVKNAIGDYVMFLDSDDYLTPNCINEALDICADRKSDLILGYVKKVIGGGTEHEDIDSTPTTSPSITTVTKTEMASLMNHLLGFKDKKFEFRPGYISDGPCSRLFKREQFEKFPFDLTPVWNEDTLWNIEMFSAAKNVRICKSVWYVYFVRENSVTQGYRPNCVQEFKYITDKVCEKGEDLWNGLIDKGIYYRVWHDIFLLSRTYIFNPKNRCGLRDKYLIMKDIIKRKSYQGAIKGVDFFRESSNSKRIVKEILRLSMRLHLYIVSFLIIRLYTQRRQV